MLSFRTKAPGRKFILLGNVEGAKKAIPEAGYGCQIGVPVLGQIAVVGVMHYRAMKPFGQPTGVVERDVVMTKGPVEPEQQGKEPDIEQGRLRNTVIEQPAKYAPREPVGECRACGIQRPLQEVFPVTGERGEHFGGVMYFVNSPECRHFVLGVVDRVKHKVINQ